MENSSQNLQTLIRFCADKKINYQTNLKQNNLPLDFLSSLSSPAPLDASLKLWGFVALKGLRNHGINFVDQAIKKGAQLVILDIADLHLLKTDIAYLALDNLELHLNDLANIFYDYPAKKLKIIATTGTNGKTSVTNLSAQLYHGLHQENVGVLGTNGNGILFYEQARKKQQFTASSLTTLDKLSLLEAFIYFIKNKIKYIFLEASSHALSLKRLVGLDLHLVAATNIKQDHLDFHKNFAHYKNSKAKLFFDFEYKYAILNADDEEQQDWLTRIKPEALATYSTNKKSDTDLTVMDYKLALTQTTAKLRYQDKNYEIDTKLVGLFNLENILLTILINIKLLKDKNPQDLFNAVANLEPIAGRFEVIQATNCFFVLDYAHTADALEKLLLNILAITQQQTIYLVFGCGGDRDKEKRGLMGIIANKLADKIIITNDNPRCENAQTIVDDILKPLNNKTKVSVILDREDAILYAANQAFNTQAIVIVAGKGNEDYQILKDKTIAFSDRDVIQKFIATKNRDGAK